MPLDATARAAAYVDELGCAADLRTQLGALVGGPSGSTMAQTRWSLTMHLDVDPVQSLCV